MNRLRHFTRANIRLPREDYAGNRLYFLTICCRDRRPYFREAAVVTSQLQLLQETSAKMEFAVHAYCFMPDHLHLLAEGLSPRSNLLDFAARFKQLSGYRHRQVHGTPFWQRKYYDHVLRRDDAIHDIAWYIWMNPVRKGLVEEPRDYPFSGSLSLGWPTGPPPTLSEPPWRR